MNTEVKTIDHPRFGKIHFRKSKRAKRLRITIDSLKKITISIPSQYPQKKAEEFFNSRIDWIEKQFYKIDNRNNFTLNNTESSQYSDPEVKLLLKNRVSELAVKYGFNYNKVQIRSQKTRWGSCSAKNNLSLNIKLYKLPAVLRDYVIIHELVHTKVKDHSKKFWQELTKYYSDPKKIDKQLRKYNLRLL